MVVHWTLPSTERQVLDSIGLSVQEIVSHEGEPIADDSATTSYFYVLARKNGGADSG